MALCSLFLIHNYKRKGVGRGKHQIGMYLAQSQRENGCERSSCKVRGAESKFVTDIQSWWLKLKLNYECWFSYLLCSQEWGKKKTSFLFFFFFFLNPFHCNNYMLGMIKMQEEFPMAQWLKFIPPNAGGVG